MGNVQKKEIDIVVAGHLCLDITPVFREDINIDVKRVFTPGTLTNMDGIKIAAAGAVPNVGITLGILGLKPWLMGKTGNDFFGRGIQNFLGERNIARSITETENGNTSYTVVIAAPGTDRIFFHDPGTNDTFTADDIDYEIVKQAKLFHFGYPPLMKKMYENDGQELVKIFRRVKELGVITSLDMAFTEPSSGSGKANWERILKNVLPFVDIFIPSIEETLYMLKKDYFTEISASGGSLTDKLDMDVLPDVGKKLMSLGIKIVAVKCGVKGYYIRTQRKELLTGISRLAPIDTDNWSDRELLAETYDVQGIKSTTGAGDSSIAGFLAAFLKGRTVEDTVKIAHAVATQSITAYDVFSNIKDFDTTSETVKNGMPVIPLVIEGSYWKYDKDIGVWKGRKDLQFDNV